MSKLQSLGPHARFAGVQQNLTPQGVIGDPIQLPEITTIAWADVVRYQTYFRTGIFSMYSPNQQTMDNFIVNMVLEHGYNSPMYRAVSRLFTLITLKLAKENNQDVPPQVMDAAARIVICNNPAVQAELGPLSKDQAHRNWFGQYNNIINSQIGQIIYKYLQVFTQQAGNFGSGQSQQQQPQSAGWGQQQPQQQVGGWGSSGQQQPVRSGGAHGLDDPTATNAPVQSAGSFSWGSEQTPAATSSAKPTAVPTTARTVEGVVVLGTDEESNNFQLSAAKAAQGGWPTAESLNFDMLTRDEVNDIALSEWVLWNAKAELNSRDVDRHKCVSLNNMLDAIGDLTTTAYTVDSGSLQERQARLTSAELMYQVGLFSNSYSYVCDLYDKPWGMESLVDLLSSEFPSKLIDAIPDSAYTTVVIGSRVYPAFNASNPDVVKLGKMYGDGLVTTNTDDIWYVVVPYVEKDGQCVKLFNLIKGNMMDLDNYRAPVKNVAPEALANQGDDTEAVLIEPEVYNYSKPLTGGVNASVDVMRVVAGEGTPAIGKLVKATFLTIPTEIDQEAFVALRTKYQAGTISNVCDLAEAYSAMLDEGTCTHYLADMLDARCQDIYMDIINNVCGLGIVLNDIWRLEVGELFDLLIHSGEHLSLENQALLKEADTHLLKTMFTEIDNEDELRLAAKIYQTSTGVETRMTKGVFNARFSSVDESRKLTLRIGEGIIPLIVHEWLVGVPQTAIAINPTSANRLSGYKLPSNLIAEINKLEGTITLITNDGVQFGVGVTGTDPLDAPELVVL